jgi:transposase
MIPMIQSSAVFAFESPPRDETLSARARIRGGERTAGEQYNRDEGRAEQTKEHAMLTVGIASAKATLEATAWREGRAMRLGAFAQTADGWAALRATVVGLQHPPTVSAGGDPADADREPVALVLEPTGGYELAFALWARRQPGWQVHRPNPARVRAWARSQGLRAKTDRQDAELLARFGASAQPALAA